MTRVVLLLVLAGTACDPAGSEAPEEPRSPAAAAAPTTAHEGGARPTKPVDAVKRVEPVNAVDAAKPADAVKPAEPAPPLPVYAESLGALRLGMTIAEMQAVHPTLVEEGEIVALPPDGGPIDVIDAYARELVDPAAHLEVSLRSKTRDGEYRAVSISIDAGSPLQTKQRIGIGSKRRAVTKAYPRALPLVEDELYAHVNDHEQVVFLFEAGKVSRMFLAAETTNADDIEE